MLPHPTKLSRTDFIKPQLMEFTRIHISTNSSVTDFVLPDVNKEMYNIYGECLPVSKY